MERRFSHTVECMQCHGAKRINNATCPLCNGAGHISPRLPSDDWLPPPPSNNKMNCSACLGTGYGKGDLPAGDDNRCLKCHGTGQVDRAHEVSHLLAMSPYRSDIPRLTMTPKTPDPAAPTRMDIETVHTARIRFTTTQFHAIIRAILTIAPLRTARHRAIHPTTVTRPNDPAPTLPHRAVKRPWWHILAAGIGTMGMLTSVVILATLTYNAGPITRPVQAIVDIATTPDLVMTAIPTASPTPTTGVPTRAGTPSPGATAIPTTAPLAPVPTATWTALPTVTTAPPTDIPLPTVTPMPPVLTVSPSTWSVTCPHTSAVITLTNVGTGTLIWSATARGNYYRINGGTSANGTIVAGASYDLVITTIYGNGVVTLTTVGQTIVVPITCV